MAAESPTNSPDVLQLAFERTFLSYERTLMAWVRTATSLITFGVALYNFAGYIPSPGLSSEPPPMIGARSFGLIMIVLGLVGLAVASWQHRLQLIRLRAHYPSASRSLSLVMAGLVAGLGFVALAAAVVGRFWPR